MDTATTWIYTVLTHSLPTRRSSDLRTVNDAFGDGLLPVQHDAVHEFRQHRITETGIGQDFAAFRTTTTSHRVFLYNSIPARGALGRSEEHTSELQSLMRISYAVFCLKKKTSTQLNKYNKLNT